MASTASRWPPWAPTGSFIRIHACKMRLLMVVVSRIMDGVDQAC